MAKALMRILGTINEDAELRRHAMDCTHAPC
jgi:hypothetical protein